MAHRAPRVWRISMREYRRRQHDADTITVTGGTITTRGADRGDFRHHAAPWRDTPITIRLGWAQGQQRHCRSHRSVIGPDPGVGGRAQHEYLRRHQRYRRHRYRRTHRRNGMTQVEMSWNWGANLATLATARVTGAEACPACSALRGGSYVTVASRFINCTGERRPSYRRCSNLLSKKWSVVTVLWSRSNRGVLRGAVTHPVGKLRRLQRRLK